VIQAIMKGFVLRKGLIIAMAAVAIAVGVLLTRSADVGSGSYLAVSQRQLLHDADLVVLAAARPEGEMVRYSVAEVWRNRTGHPLPWADGMPIPELDARLHPESAFAQTQVAFYRWRDGSVAWIGSLMAADRTVMLRVDDLGNPVGSARRISLERLRTLVRQANATSGR
jgi:hypothetical protein